MKTEVDSMAIDIFDGQKIHEQIDKLQKRIGELEKELKGAKHEMHTLNKAQNELISEELSKSRKQIAEFNKILLESAHEIIGELEVKRVAAVRRELARIDAKAAHMLKAEIAKTKATEFKRFVEKDLAQFNKRIINIEDELRSRMISAEVAEKKLVAAKVAVSKSVNEHIDKEFAKTRDIVNKKAHELEAQLRTKITTAEEAERKFAGAKAAISKSVNEHVDKKLKEMESQMNARLHSAEQADKKLAAAKAVLTKFNDENVKGELSRAIDILRTEFGRENISGLLKNINTDLEAVTTDCKAAHKAIADIVGTVTELREEMDNVREELKQEMLSTMRKLTDDEDSDIAAVIGQIAELKAELKKSGRLSE
jgi:hypothetical protein